MSIRSDNPIKKTNEDTLGRSKAAIAFAKQIKGLDASEGLVVGVLGPWGSGKTSFINLVRNKLAKDSYPILEFNPWMFSGANQLVESFFIEVSAQLKIKDSHLQEIGKEFEEYGEVLTGLGWLPVVGPWIERFRLLGKGASKILKKKKEGTGAVRKKLTEALSDLDKPIVVVLDDIDRLSTQEIRDIFKLVRLTASFPNIIYVLAFDRARVEQALTEEGIPGRDYLEKILQIAIDLPVIPPGVLNKQIFAIISDTLDKVKNTGPFDENKWPDIYYEIIRPLIRNMRDVRRYSASIHGTVQSLEGQVALHDVLAIEAIRIFLPDVYSEIAKSVEGLTEMSSGYTDRDDPPRLKASIERIIQVAPEHEELVKDLIKRVFPAAERHIGNMHYGPDYQRKWLRERRLANESILRIYLERQGNDKFDAFIDAERAFSLMANQIEFEKFLRGLEPDRLEDVISALENYEDEFPVKSIVPSVSVLLNMLPDLPEKERVDMFALDTRLVVGRVVYRLIKKMPDPEATLQAVKKILPNLNTLSSKYELITDVGYREGAGHKLVTEEAASELERALRDEIRAASASKLAKEYELLRLLLMVTRESADDEPDLNLPNNYRLTHSMIKNAQSKMRSQSWGDRAVKITPVLAWDVLIGLFGTEDELVRRANTARSHYHDEKGLYELVDKYASGWQPNRDDD